MPYSDDVEEVHGGAHKLLIVSKPTNVRNSLSNIRAHSKDLLINTELKVYEIAEKVGYRNVDYFHTKFKKYVKESPAEFRKKNK